MDICSFKVLTYELMILGVFLIIHQVLKANIYIPSFVDEGFFKKWGFSHIQYKSGLIRYVQ